MSSSQTGQIYYQSLTPPPPLSSFSPVLDKEFESDIFQQQQQTQPIQNNLQMQTLPVSPRTEADNSSTTTTTVGNYNSFQQMNTSPECNGCLCLIQDRYYLLVMDRAWHLNCLRCYDCKLSLDSQQSCFAKDGVIYCKEDYIRRFPRKCNGCNQEITPNELIMRARNSVFHMHCFKCLVCDKQLNTGDEYGIGKDNISIFCRSHYTFNQIEQQNHHQVFSNLNHDSNHLIKSEYTTNNNQYNNDFNKPTFDSYYQQSELVVPNYNSYLCNLPPTPGISPPNSQQFHTPTSNQKDNSNQLKGRPKKRKANSDGSTQSNKKMLNSKNVSKQSTTSNTTASINSPSTIKNEAVTSKMTTNSVSNTVSSPQQQQQQQQQQNILGSSDSPDDYSKNFDSNLDYFSDDDDDDLLDTSSNGQNENSVNGCHTLLNSNASGYYDSVAAVAAAAAAAQRQKRMRTSFKHHQLRVMKSYFELNHNPDAKDLKQLSQKTGLSKRVLQVWFQNARAKFRRGQGGPDCPPGPPSPNPNSSLNIGGSNNGNQGISSSSSSLSSNSSSSSSSTSSDLTQNILQQQQQSTPSNMHQSNIHSLNLDMIDETSNNDQSHFSNFTNLNPSGNPQGHIQLNSQPSYQMHMLQQQAPNGEFIGDNLIIS